VFPGCDMPTSWCDAHHVIAWEAGGDTDMVNLALLCRYHHGISRQPPRTAQVPRLARSGATDEGRSRPAAGRPEGKP